VAPLSKGNQSEAHSRFHPRHAAHPARAARLWGSDASAESAFAGVSKFDPATSISC
jgi:hypothetical protein